MTTTAQTQTTTTFELATHLYQHVGRPDWGQAIGAGRVASGRRYQFEDGTLRTIASAYDHLMQPASATEDSARVIADLSRKLGVSTMRMELARRGDDKDLLSVADQIAVFRGDYPGGFRDPKWVKEVRGLGAARPTRKHRNAAVVRAQRLLAAERLRVMMAEGRDGAIIADLVEVLGGTDLVSRPTDVRPLADLGPDHHAPVARALFELLHGEDDVADRMDRCVWALEAAGVRPTWTMVTTPLSLFSPRQHVVVRPSCFKRQAQWMGLELGVTSRPVGAVYLQLRQVAAMQEQDLVAAGLAPRDFLSIHDFIRLTTRAKVAKAGVVDASQVA